MQGDADAEQTQSDFVIKFVSVDSSAAIVQFAMRARMHETAFVYVVAVCCLIAFYRAGQIQDANLSN